jgi:cell pole-organizing protein PopZ
MEEILSSIRRIIADEEAEDGASDDDELGAAEAQADALNEDADALAQAAEDEESEDVLELTRVVRDTGEVVDLKAEDEARAGPAMKSAATRAELLSASAATAASGAFAKLSQAFQRTPAEESVADDSGRTVEQFVEDMIRPMLKEWLDENLPKIVDRLVEREIQKIARRAELM